MPSWMSRDVPRPPKPIFTLRPLAPHFLPPSASHLHSPCPFFCQSVAPKVPALTGCRPGFTAQQMIYRRETDGGMEVKKGTITQNISGVFQEELYVWAQLHQFLYLDFTLPNPENHDRVSRTGIFSFIFVDFYQKGGDKIKHNLRNTYLGYY